ncbi:hypothetical protein BST97_12365 [Nonlabens spongiae]|uniref:TonB-dependent receptor n=2 Tax=Nonlabens spongiae TaxID=331648 RepID=A0A1W6MM92_9FLAO|nr:hypothetical protein BST97_12365 [Nonlabens spongiae]
MVFVSLKPLHAQKLDNNIGIKHVQGVVIDSDGEPVLGQTVRISGTERYSISDFDGKFCISVPKGFDIYLSVPCCYNPMILKLDSEDNEIKVDLGSKKLWRKSKRYSRIYRKRISSQEEIFTRFYKTSLGIPEQMTCETSR